MPGPTSKFDSLQAQLRANEEEFNQRMGITPEKKPEPAKMPGANPWSGELKEKRKKSSASRQTSRQDAENGEEDEGEWEWEEDEEEVEDKPEDATGKAAITIDGNLLKINRGPVDWSDDEFEDDDDEPKAAAPPPPPPAPPAPPPPPPPPGPGLLKPAKSDRVEALKKRPTKRPDWNDLMQEIEKYRCKSGLLTRVQTNDRSQPMLSKAKVKGVFVYESEKTSKDKDILKEISEGSKLKHVRCNDRSKPNLRGIKAFKRQLTKEEKLKKGFSFGEDAIEEDLEDLTKIKDDLESTKQMLELEVRSKGLLEKDNKRLQAEIERLKSEFDNMKDGGQPSQEIMASILSVRKDSVKREERKERRKSSTSMVSEAMVSEIEEDLARIREENGVKQEEVIEEMEELKDEVEEARKLAMEWEARYKEMQRQIEDIEGAAPYGKKNSNAGFERPALQRGLSTASSDGAGDLEMPADKRASVSISETDGDDWMQKREVQMLRVKLKNTKDKKEMIVRERKMLNERVENLKESIAVEVEARKKLKKEVKDMNAAFMEEMADMELEEDIEEMDTNTHKKEKAYDEDGEEDEYAFLDEEDEVEESVEDLLKSAEEAEEMEVDPGEDLFNKLNEDTVEDDTEESGYEKQLEHLNRRIEQESEKVQTMRKSNFSLKSRIDILHDLLQTQKEKHYDLKQELNRMLSDIQ